MDFLRIVAVAALALPAAASAQPLLVLAQATGRPLVDGVAGAPPTLPTPGPTVLPATPAPPAPAVPPAAGPAPANPTAAPVPPDVVAPGK